MAEACPVCKGSGLMPRGFYLGVEIWDDTGTGSDICRACNGSGIILGHPNANVWIKGGIIDYEDNITFILATSSVGERR